MENNKPRTMEELFIEKYQKLEEENKDLKAKAEMYEQRCDELENTLEQVGKDFGIYLSEYADGSKYIGFSSSIWNNTRKKEYQYYKKMFKLKEKGEEDNEQRCSENNQA